MNVPSTAEDEEGTRTTCKFTKVLQKKNGRYVPVRGVLSHQERKKEF